MKSIDTSGAMLASDEPIVAVAIRALEFGLVKSEQWPWVVPKLYGNNGSYIEELGKLDLGFEAYKREFFKHSIPYLHEPW